MNSCSPCRANLYDYDTYIGAKALPFLSALLRQQEFTLYYLFHSATAHLRFGMNLKGCLRVAAVNAGHPMIRTTMDKPLGTGTTSAA
jgi:hypothetical protein